MILSSVVVTGLGVVTPIGSGVDAFWSPAHAGSTVSFAGLAPGYTAGLQQINIRIPDDCPAGAALPIRLQLGAHSTQLGTTIAVE